MPVIENIWKRLAKRRKLKSLVELSFRDSAVDVLLLSCQALLVHALAGTKVKSLLLGFPSESVERTKNCKVAKNGDWFFRESIQAIWLTWTCLSPVAINIFFLKNETFFFLL